ncbi:hypothetical protein QTO34_012014 [Cnephaeus nilssonii]|uniref:Potassium channel tetramerisation-type BTB domain-containing protein n=1 Tax=Cnephaeus nilssonii TaxID=3371016 RepID=A0AA40LCP3_CNENI|nr:hypothetical protein QTO34_012014 [Eptesicus nilssonii]
MGAAIFVMDDGWILIDRCGKHFGTILNYLRDGAVPLPESRREIEELLAEAKYYLVQGLVEECQAALQNKDAYEPFCKVPVITSSKEEQKLIATSNKTREGVKNGNLWLILCSLLLGRTVSFPSPGQQAVLPASSARWQGQPYGKPEVYGICTPVTLFFLF